MTKHKHGHDHPCHCGHRHHGKRGHDHRCDCSEHHDHNHHAHQREGGSGAGFAFGVTIGAVAATLLAPDQGKKTRDRAKRKLDELTGGKTPEELLETVKGVVYGVVGDIRSATEAGKQEAKRERRKVLESSKRRRKS